MNQVPTYYRPLPTYYRPLPTNRKVKRGWWRFCNAPIHIGVRQGYIYTAALYASNGMIDMTYSYKA